MRRALPLAALALVLTACGNDHRSPAEFADPAGPDAATSNASTGAGDVSDTVQQYVTALQDGDGRTAHLLLSDRCRRVLSADALSAAGNSERERLRNVNGWSVNATGNKATVTYSHADEDAAAATQEWVIDGGQWRSDAC